MIHKTFQFGSRVRSFLFAFQGLWFLLKSQQNARIHAGATLTVLILGLLFGISTAEWCALVLAIMAVWTAEAINTAFELLADAAFSTFHPLVKQAKDVAAGAVLISAIGALVIGLLIFGPHLIEW